MAILGNSSIDPHAAYANGLEMPVDFLKGGRKNLGTIRSAYVTPVPFSFTELPTFPTPVARRFASDRFKTNGDTAHCIFGLCHDSIVSTL